MEWTSAAVVCSLLLLFPALPLDAITVSGFNQELKASFRMSKGENGGVQEIHCSRERSRAARDIIEEYLMPFVEREKYEIPNSCRIHPNNDMFGEQENHKIHVDEKEWRCGYCKKTFISEKYLDQHLDSRHDDLLNVSQARCLADLCGALHCDFYMNPKSPRKCNPAAAARNRLMCESLADSCFPVSWGSSASRLHELFIHQFCEAHSCSGGKKPFAKGGMKQSSVLYLSLSILTLMMLPLFYVIVYLHQYEIRKDTQELKRISLQRQKAKPS